MPALATVGELIGRSSDCAEIDELLDRARGGRSGALMLRGEAGIGKTSLLRYAVHRATGMLVLAARGIESESELPFAGLSELVRPVLGRLSSLPERQAAALAGALAVGPPTGADPLAVAAATLGLLAAAAAEGPVLAVVDDLQWLDTSSAEALLFAARRLDEEAVALLFAERDGEAVSHAQPGFPVRLLSGLDRASSVALVAAVADEPAAAQVAERLFLETNGNPLALIEITQLLANDAGNGAEAPDGAPLPAGERIGRAFARQVAGLPRATQDVLLLAAANDAADVDPVLRALPVIGLRPEDLDAAETTGLITARGARLEFRHPLVRSAVYHGAEAHRRRAAHSALATALSETAEAPSARHAWHLAAATLGCDDGVADALERAAVSARHRSGYPAAARTYERAGRLSSGREARARRLFAAADAWQLANRYDHAVLLLEEAARLTVDRLLSADIAHLQARIDTWRGPAVDACDRLRELAEQLHDIAPGRAAAMLADATLAGITGGELRRGLANAELAHEIAAPIGGTVELLAALQLGKARILTGDVPHGYPLIMRARELLGGDDPPMHGAELVRACRRSRRSRSTSWPSASWRR